MPLCSSGSACPWALAAFGKPIHPTHTHSSGNLVILCISLHHVLAAISPFDLFGCAFVLLSAAVALPLMYKQELSSTVVVFCFIFINAVDSQRSGGEKWATRSVIPSLNIIVMCLKPHFLVVCPKSFARTQMMGLLQLPLGDDATGKQKGFYWYSTDLFLLLI